MTFGFDIITGFLSELIPHLVFSLVFTVVCYFIWESTSLQPLNFNSWIVRIRRRRSSSLPVVSILPITELDTIDTDFIDPSDLNTISSSLASEEEERSEERGNRFLVVQAIATQNLTPEILTSILNHNYIMDSVDSTTSGQQQGARDAEQASPPIAVTPSQASSQPDDSPLLTDSSNSSAADSICIRIKFLDDTLKIVHANKNVTVGIFKREHFSDDLKSGKVVRLIFQGRLLRDDSSTLDSYGLIDQSVLHCHIGTRPYNTNNVTNDTNGTDTSQNNIPSNSPGILGGGPRMIETGFWIIFFNLIIAYAWNLVRITWEWANQQEEEVPPSGRVSSFIFYFRQKLRRCISIFLDVLVGPAFARQEAQQHRHPDDTRYNIGNLMALIVFVKFLLLWCFVLVYPQFTDRRSIFFLSMLTSTSGLYFYFSRANAIQRQRRSVG